MASQARIRAAEKYTGALNGSEPKVNLDNFDPVLFSQRLYESAPLRLTFRAQTAAYIFDSCLQPKIFDT